MVVPRVSQALARLVVNSNVNVQTRRSIYPHYVRFMAAFPKGYGPPPFYEKVAVYLGFMAAIFGIPCYIMYDVGKKRPAIQGVQSF